MYRGGAEKQIRKYLIDNNFIDCIIQLPDNLFYGTTIATCIMVLKKSKRITIRFLDASKQCVKITNSNKLTGGQHPDDPDRVSGPRRQAPLCRPRPQLTIIAEQDYNLSVSTYVEQEDTREVIDIQKLNAEIAQIVAREQKLRRKLIRSWRRLREETKMNKKRMERNSKELSKHLPKGRVTSL